MHFYYLHFPVVFIVFCLGYTFDDCSITLIRGGDVELNPGPNSGETERSSIVKQISFCHLNIHSLLARGDCGPRLDHLYNLVSDNNYDVIALSETLLSDAINDDEICMEGYEVFRLDRTRHGGGVALYCRTELQCKVVPALHIDGIEMLWVEALLNGQRIVFGVCYRPPNQTANERSLFLDGMYATFDAVLRLSNSKFVLLGDFNDRCQIWNSDHRDSELGLDLFNLLLEFGLMQLINEPTRNANILDLIITNIPNLIESYGVSDPINDLDHCSIYGLLKFTYVKKLCYLRTISSYTFDNLTTLNDNLSHVPWPSLIISESGNIDDMVDSFTTILKDEIANAIPSKTVVIRPKDKPGMTCLVRSLFRKCHRLHKIAMQTKNAADLEKHRTARREAKAALKQAQRIYYEKLNKQMENPETRKKSYWKMIKSFQGQTKTTSIPEIVENGKSYRDVKDIVTILNNYFVAQTKIVHLDESSLVPVVGADVNAPVLNSIEITSENILNSLKNLKLGKSCGMDGIGNNILRACAPNLTEPLKMIAQKSLDTGVFPNSWKKSNVVPIFKHKGAKNSVANYRPISLLSCMSKVVERQVYNELYNFCMENRLLSEKNSGFKKKVGTIDQLISLTNKIYQGLDNEEEIAMIFLDLSKAYDRVWHAGLLYKLEKIGIRGSLLAWFKSYLTAEA